LDQVKKAYPKLMPADAALLTTALVSTGRHAFAIYEGEQYVWPKDNDRLQTAMIPHVKITQEAIEANTTKKAAKNAPEDEPVQINVGLTPDYSAGEKYLQDRKDLKTLLSDILQEGVEFAYQPSDIGWQWALDRANWSTIAGQDISRRIKVKTAFTEGAVGVEMGAAGAKKKSTRKTVEISDVAEDGDLTEPLDESDLDVSEA
jgi:hypothetical protein